MANLIETPDSTALIKAKRIIELCEGKDYHAMEFDTDEETSVVTIQFPNETIVVDNSPEVMIIQGDDVLTENWDHLVLRLMKR